MSRVRVGAVDDGLGKMTTAKPTGGFRSQIEAREAAWLSDLATLSYPAERDRDEPDAPYRTPFQRDRDRIVHSKAFRRLKRKTQVFVAPTGDHFRTRMTHTLEVTGLARTVARALRLNEDLTEAIGVGHDLGHPPFGHAGESALASCLERTTGQTFKHNEHSLRIVEQLEGPRAGGLNLTVPVRDGILNHTGSTHPGTLEGKIVRLVDRVAYLNHDFEDAVRANVLTAADLPARELELLGQTASDRMDTLMTDLIETSLRAGDIEQSKPIGDAMLRLRKFMFDRVYLGPPLKTQQAQIAGWIELLFDHFVAHPELLPVSTDQPIERRAVDWIAGMTDRYALRVLAELGVADCQPK